MGVLTPPNGAGRNSVCGPNGGGGRGSQAGNHGVSEKVRRQDATDRDEVGEHRRVNPKVLGGDQVVQGTLILHPSPPHAGSSRGGGGGRMGVGGDKELKAEWGRRQ